MNAKLLALLPFLIIYAMADTMINLNSQQLKEAQDTIQTDANQAITKIPETGKELAATVIESLDLSTARNEINQAQAQFSKVKPLSTQLAAGQNYYLYSESLVSTGQQNQSQPRLLDINQTISRYNALLKNSQTWLGDARLLIFISSSMPKKSIANLMTQAAPLGAVFVVRGLMDGSYVRTYRYFYNLKGDMNVGIMINPPLFKNFAIDAVPSFALYQSKDDLLQTACKTTPSYSKVSGEVSVRYALEQLRRSQVTNLAQIAASELDVLEQSSFYERAKK